MNNANGFRWFCRENLAGISLLIAVTIFTFSACILFIITSGFALGVILAKWQILLALLVTFLLSYFFSRSINNGNPFRQFIIIAGVFLFLLVTTVLISDNFYDLSWDGQAYHQEAIIALDQGWNPVYQSLPKDQPYAIWIEHYPKTGEILVASLYQLTGRIETGKAFNLLFIFASFLLSFSVLLGFKKINMGIAFVSALIVALNPVSVYQAMTFYIDGLLGSVIASFLAVCILIFKGPNRVLLGTLSALSLVLVNLKFTALLYGIIILLGLFISLWVSKNKTALRTVVLVSIVSLFTGVFLIGFNPYITNTSDHQHPFYPIFGPNKINIGVENTTPGYFLKMNRWERLFYSNFAPSDNNLGPELKFKLKIPFTNLNEGFWFACPDVRTGGFGPLFGGVLTLFFILLIGCLIYFNRKNELEPLKWACIVMVVIFISVIINPETWWARYIPQLWYLPVCIIPLLAYQNQLILKIGKYLLIGVLLLNVYIVASFNFQSNLGKTQVLKNQLRKMASQNKVIDVYFGHFPSNRVRFEEMGIKYREWKDETSLEREGKTSVIIWPNVKVGLRIMERDSRQ